MRTLLKVLFVVAGIWLISCFVAFAISGCAYPTKTNHFGAVNLEKAIENLVILETRARVKGQIDPAVMRAIAIPIGDGLIAALSHATKTEPYVRVRSPFGRMVIPREIISEKWFIGKTEATFIGRKDDLSVFQADIPQEFPYRFGDSDRLRAGDKIALIGYSYGQAICVKSGVVANPKYTADDFDFDAKLVAPVILMDISGNPGDSGGPVLTYQDGTLKIVGIQCAILGYDGIGVAYQSNYSQETIAEILEGEIDDLL